jgi:CRP-like cAMP-binding protein
MMPELDGYGVFYILSKNPETAATPFIFLSAKAEKADLRKGMSLGADDYLTKPYDDMDLLNAVESRLKKFNIVKKEFSQNVAGVQEFMQEAKDLSAIKDLAEENKTYSYKIKEFIFREGDIANFLFFVEEGQVKTYKLNADGKELIMETFGSGDFIGYKALLEDRPYSEYASTLEETCVYKIPKADFLQLIFNNRDVSARFLKMVSHNLSEKEEQLIQLAYDSVKKRIAHQIKQLAHKSSNYSFEMSRGDLAKIVGTSKETLVRTLTSLKEDGIIDSDGHSIEIKDQKKLDQMLMWS